MFNLYGLDIFMTILQLPTMNISKIIQLLLYTTIRITITILGIIHRTALYLKCDI
jgi:hypothetical protein